MLFWVGVVVAQVVSQVVEDWWQTPTGRNVGYLLSVFVALGIIAGGVKGAQYLAKTALGAHVKGLQRWRESRARERLLDEMLSPEGWPTLIANVEGLHDRLERIETQLSEIGRE